ncbi:MAG: Phosphoglycolate phosphatase [Verrucomicrobia bacterium ADurb.Bin345]|nr:MAG: Phosphoglycolate phosphatase [Verrucomicrobia bacterium ADurb.Bin345]
MKLICDFDGTLLDVTAKYCAIYAEFMREHSAQALPAAEYWRLKRAGLSESDILAATGCPKELGPRLRDYVRDHIERPEALARDRLFAGAKAAIEALGVAHDLILFSLRRDGEAFQRQVDQLGLRPFFVKVMSAGKRDEAGTRETPKSAILRKEGLTSRDWIIGDSEGDVVTARQLGIHICAVSSGVRDANVLADRHPDLLLGGVAQVPGELAKKLGATV